MLEFVSIHSFKRAVIGALAVAAAALACADDAVLTDPTRPSGYTDITAPRENASEKLTLTLIRLGARPQAVINGKTVAPGATIAGYRLLSLQTASAILIGPNGRTVLQLAPSIRTTTSTISTQKR